MKILMLSISLGSLLPAVVIAMEEQVDMFTLKFTQGGSANWLNFIEAMEERDDDFECVAFARVDLSSTTQALYGIALRKEKSFEHIKRVYLTQAEKKFAKGSVSIAPIDPRLAEWIATIRQEQEYHQALFAYFIGNPDSPGHCSS